MERAGCGTLHARKLMMRIFKSMRPGVFVSVRPGASGGVGAAARAGSRQDYDMGEPQPRLGDGKRRRGGDGHDSSHAASEESGDAGGPRAARKRTRTTRTRRCHSNSSRTFTKTAS